MTRPAGAVRTREMVKPVSVQSAQSRNTMSLAVSGLSSLAYRGLRSKLFGPMVTAVLCSTRRLCS